MDIRFTILGRLDGLNDYTKANRTSHYVGSAMKQRNQRLVRLAIKQAKLNRVERCPVRLQIVWYEPNSRRDIDNIIFAQKFILDALVDMKILKNDSQKYVKKISHEVLVDKENPRIEVTITQLQ